jgi:hypothetical protein
MTFMKVGSVIVVIQVINAFFPINFIFFGMNWAMFAVEYLHVIQFSSYKFCVYNASGNLPGGINEILPLLFTFFVCF